MPYTKELDFGQFIPVQYHYQMLADEDRMRTFKAAIAQAVSLGMKVAELGCGTGVMSFFAARSGAKVWSVEYNPALVEASRRFISMSPFADQVHIEQGDACYWLPPKPVDLVICEMLHSALLQEKQLKVLSSFREGHFARYGCIPKFLPTATLLAVQPLVQDYDFHGYRAPIPYFQSAYDESKSTLGAGDPVVYKIVDYSHATNKMIQATVSLPIHCDAQVNALRFITKNILTMNLKDRQTVDWHSQHLVLPLPKTCDMKTGQVLNIQFQYQPGDTVDTLQKSLIVQMV